MKWEVYLQKRTQNDEESSTNIFKHHQTSNYWLWLHYQTGENTVVSITPFCYFNTIGLFPQAADVGDRGIKEFRWAAQIEHTENLKNFKFANRYSVEYRYRDVFVADEFVPNYRIRYRAKLEKPILTKTHPLSIVVFDEIFLEFGKAVENSPAVFNQNRLYAGFYYGLMKNVKFNLGYMYLVQERGTGKAIDISNVIWSTLIFENLFSQFTKK
jgi:hypothetical protein